MKKNLSILIVALLFCNIAISRPHKDYSTSDLQSEKTKTFFIENRGQVYDQNFNPRPDVLFIGSTGEMGYHFRKNGMSYQLMKVESWKKRHELPAQIKTVNPDEMLPEKMSIYRLDLEWLNANETNQSFTATANGNYAVLVTVGGCSEMSACVILPQLV